MLGRHIASLDGVRGLAILIVLCHHLVMNSGIDRSHWRDLRLFNFAYSSWVGVDLFFVLSGFLITGILFDAKESGRYFSSFYGRRLLRIFPLYYGSILLALLVFPLLLTPEVAQELADTQAWYWLYLTNVYVALHGWPGTYLGHFWSLAIEEQFYLLWPIAVWALSRTRLLRLAAGCFLMALVLRVVMPFGMTTLGAYVLLPTRMDTLAAGAFLALLVRGDRGLEILGRWPWVLLGACSLAVAFFYHWKGRISYHDRIVSTVGYSILALAFAALIALLLKPRPGNAIQAVFARGPLVFLGKYSYGLYVIHVPIIHTLANAGLKAGLFPRIWGSSILGVVIFCVIAGVLSLLLAIASYRWWESPFLRLKRYLPYRVPPSAPPKALANTAEPGDSSPEERDQKREPR